MKRILNKKLTKEGKRQLKNVIDNINNNCSLEEMLEEASKSTIKAEDIKVEEYILLPNGELVIK